MSTELVISTAQNGCRIALLKNKTLTEFHEENKNQKFVVGDIYLGTVKKVVQGLNAAFVDVGYEKDAFLHYLDLGVQFRSLQKYVKLVRSRQFSGENLDGFQPEPDIEKHGKISQRFSRNQLVLVQIVKEPISTKGPRLSCELSLAGRYLVLVPFSSTVSVSKKISSDEEKRRLLHLIQSIKPENFGVIIRTVAKDKEVAQLDRDLKNLVRMWQDGMKNFADAKPREKIIGEIDKASSILRDVLNESFDSISVDDKGMYEEIKNYIHTIAPEKEKIVKYYSGKPKIFEYYGVERQIKSAFGQTVNLQGGGYLIIEHTEALHVIDVNSGNKSIREESQEATALSVNLEAIKEIARQFRLRDIGGIIVIDFIDMKNIENKKLIYSEMKEAMQDSDRAKHTILPLSRFGLMQITRSRVRAQTNIATKEACPTCNGSGSIAASIIISDSIEKNVRLLSQQNKHRHITLRLHPYLYTYFTAGFISRRLKWLFRHKKWINMIQDTSLSITECYYLNKNGEEILTDLHKIN